MNKRSILALPVLFFIQSTLSAAARADVAGVTDIPVGLAYAADGVNADVYRVNALITAQNHQYVTYYDGDGSVVVGQRQIGQTNWDLAVQPFKGKVSDAHNDVVLGISGDGVIHIAYNHHGDPLHYRVSDKPYDIHHFRDEQSMTGDDEDHVTYPQFLNAPSGDLYFFYRDGASGNGNLCVNRYDNSAKAWQSLFHPLIDGENKCNPYWWRPSIGADGSVHIAWCWRDSPDASTNHDLCYVHSKDNGHSWVRSDGKTQEIPITQENAEVVDPIKKGSNLINQCSTAVDAQGHVHLAQYFNDENGIPQYFDEWFDGAWHKSQVTHRTAKFSISGGGSLAIPISRPEIAAGPDGSVVFITRDAEVGGGIRLYRSKSPFEQWTAIDLTHEDLGNWEPEYDLSRLREGGILSLFVLPVRQGNHERTTNFPPQMAHVVEVPLSSLGNGNS